MKTSKGCFSKFLSLSKRFYCQELYSLIHAANRNQIFSLFLISIRVIEFFACSLIKRTNEFISADYNFSFLEDYNLSNIYQNTNNLTFTRYFSAACNFSIVGFILISFTLFLIKLWDEKSIKQSLELKLNACQLLEESTIQRRSTIIKMFSILMGIYSYVFFIPFVFLNLQDSDNSLAIINIIISTLINAVISDCEYNYQIKSDDFLSKPFSYPQWLLTSAIEITLLVSMSNISEGQCIISAVEFLLSFLVNIIYSPYYHKLTQQVSLWCQMYFLCLSVVTEIIMQFNVIDQTMSIYYVLAVPISYKIGKILVDFAEKQCENTIQSAYLEYLSNKSRIEITDLDMIMRSNIEGENVDSRMRDHSQIRLLSIIVNFALEIDKKSNQKLNENNNPNIIIENLKDSKSNRKTPSNSYKNEVEQINISRRYEPKSFEQDIKLNERLENIDYYSESNPELSYDIKSEIIEIIKKSFEKIIKLQRRKRTNNHTSVSNIMIIYLIYLIQIGNQHRLYYFLYSEIIKNHLPMKLNQILYSVHSLFLAERNTARKIKGQGSTFDGAFVQVIVFERRLNESLKLFEDALKIKIEVLQIMRQKIIDSQKLIIKTSDLQNVQNILKQNINSLTQVNDDNTELIGLQAMYLECLAFTEKDIIIARKNRFSKITNQFDKDNGSSYLSRDRFDENTCMLFAVSEDMRRFSVKQVSANFQEIFKFSVNEDIIGHSIDAIIPRFVQGQHLSYVEDFFNESMSNTQQLMEENKDQEIENSQKIQKTIDNNGNQSDLIHKSDSNLKGKTTFQFQKKYGLGCKMNQKIIFAQIFKGIVLPVSIDIRLNSLMNYCGLTAKIKLQSQDKQFLLFDEGSLQVLAMTEIIKYELFGDFIQDQLNMQKVFPFLNAKNQKLYDGKDNEDDNSKKSPTETIKLEKQNFKTIPLNIEEALRGHAHLSKKMTKSDKMTFIIIQPNEITTKDSSGGISTKKSFASFKQSMNLRKSFAKLDSQPYQSQYQQQYSFLFIEFELKKLEYSNVDNICYLEITKLRTLSEIDHAAFILEYINTPLRLKMYERQIPSIELERIVSEIEKQANCFSQSAGANGKRSSFMGESSFLQSNYVNMINNNNHKKINGSKDFNMQGDIHKKIEIDEDKILLNREISNHSLTNQSISRIFEDIHNKLGKSQHTILEESEANSPNGNKSGTADSFGDSNNHIWNNNIPRTDQRSLFSINSSHGNGQIHFKKKDKDNKNSNHLQKNYGTPAQAVFFNSSAEIDSKFISNNLYNNNQSNLISPSGILKNNNVSVNSSIAQLPYEELTEGLIYNKDSSLMALNKNQISTSNNNIPVEGFQQQLAQLPSSSQIGYDQTIQQQQGVNSLAISSNPLEFKFFSPRMTPSSNGYNHTKEFPLFSGKSLLDPQNISSPLNSKQILSQQTQEILGNNSSENQKLNYFKSSINQGKRESEKKKKKQKNQQVAIGAKANPKQYISQVSTIRRWSDADVKATKKRKIDEIQADLASTNSKDSSYASAKRQLLQILGNSQTLNLIKMINTVGIICYLTMVILTLNQYLETTSQLSNQHLDYLVFDWPTKYQSTLSVILKKQNILFMTQGSYFSFDSTAVKNQFQIDTKLDMIAAKDVMRTMLGQIDSADSNRKVFQLFRNHYIVMQLGKYYDTNSIVGTSSVPSKFVVAPYNATLQEGVIIGFQHVYRYVVGAGKGRPEYYLILNQLNQISSLKQIQNEMVVLQKDQQNSITDQLTQLMVIIIVINAICIGVIIPLFYFIQVQRDNVVQLFGTFPTNKIEGIILGIQKSYSSYINYNSFKDNRSIKSALLRVQFMDQTQKDARKQNISTVTQLPKFNSKVFLAVFLVYVLIICYPILNKIVTQNYLSVASLDLETMTNVYSLRSFMLENIAMHYNIMTMKLYPTLKPMSPTIYYEYTLNLINQADEFNSKIDWLIKDQYSSSRYNQDQYDGFFFSSLKGNLCSTFEKYPEYNTNFTKVNPTNCSTLHYGFLSQGIQVSYKEYLSLFPPLYNLYVLSETTDVKAQVTQFLNTFNLKDYTAFQESLEEAIVSLKAFVLLQHQNYYDYIVQFQNAMLIYQMILMALVFLIGWMQFSSYLNFQMHSTKSFLKIIDINSLIDNSYVLTYIKKNTQI